MRLHFVIFVSVACLVLAGCDGILGPSNAEPGFARIPLDERVTSGYTDFGFDLFRELTAEEPNANVFVSPTSAALALAMVYHGAAGTTAEEIAQTLGVAGIEIGTLRQTSRAWLASLRNTGDSRTELAAANSVWHRDENPLRPAYLEQVGSYYDAAIYPLTTPDAVNAWVSEATRGRIDRIVYGDRIPRSVVALLINALYFHGEWAEPFDPALTRERNFRRADGSLVSVPMMYRHGVFDVRQDAGIEMIRLPYGAGRFSMVLALPVGENDVGSIIERLDASSWRAWMRELEPRPRALMMPRMELQWEASLVPGLRALGMEAPFEAGVADLSPMLGYPGLGVEDVLHKTRLQVDERGTTAAAATRVSIRVSGALTFDRPFMLAIYDHATETVLFLGRITDPMPS